MYYLHVLTETSDQYQWENRTKGFPIINNLMGKINYNYLNDRKGGAIVTIYLVTSLLHKKSLRLSASKRILR